MGLNKDLMIEIAELEAELEDEDEPPTERREMVILRRLDELQDLQAKYNDMLRDLAHGRK